MLQRQCRARVGLVDHAAVRQGFEAVHERVRVVRADGMRFGIVDAIASDDLMTMGHAFADLPLLGAGSGLATGLPQNHGLAPSAAAAWLPAVAVTHARAGWLRQAVLTSERYFPTP